LGGQGITEEENQVDVAIGDPRTNLLVPYQGTTLEAMDNQTGFFHHSVSGRSGREQLMPREDVPVSFTEGNHLVFFLVMGYDCNFHGITSSTSIHERVESSDSFVVHGIKKTGCTHPVFSC
jgi:hypothetical protein